MSTYVWTDSYWINVKDEPYIMIYGRNYDNPYETRIFKVKNFKPYFYAPADEVRGDGEELIDAYGRRVKKVTCALPSHVSYERDFFSWTDEADIPFDLRFMIDAGIYYAFHEKLKPVEVQKPIKPRICYFDIEVSKPDGTLPDFHSPHHPVVMIQCLDSYTDEIKIFTWNIPKVSDEQILCKNEKMLFFQFSQYILKNDFDVLCGWFSNSFDLPYLKARADFLRANLSIGRPPNISDVYASDNGVRILGRQAFDLLDAFKKWHSAKGELESYSLKSIAKTFCNFVYEDYGDSIAKMMEEGNYETLVEYGRNDVIALKLIDEKLGLINFFEYIRFIVGCKLEDTLFNGKVVDTLLLRETERPLPTKERREGKNYTGAFVLEPPVGIHEWVGVFDLASLYPTIMIAFNVSPDIDKIIPKTVSKILSERERLRKLRLEGKADESTKLKEYVLKTIANSFYGVQGWSGFRMYDRECAEFVTRKGRELIQYLINCAEDLGFNVLYSDSVRGDMRVFVKDKGYVKIEDLFKDVSYSILEKEYYVPQEDIYVLSMSKDGKVEFKKVKYVMRHYIDDEIREVVLDEKKKIYLTKEHSIMKYINKRERRKGSGVYEVVKPDDLLGKSVIYQKKYGGYDDGIRNKNMERFWELVGFVYGDGWWGKNKYYVKVSFGNDVDELVEYFGQLKEAGLITNI
ncbi:MAG: DNA polymerase domain-containing protein, partial [Candidatus Thorarchaeota archaeon]